ncbi:flagellar hook-length control protein FliK [Buchnera aphidicola]|nr:flagellar hook-length control protein FliK [Buchnera aphidicola]
MLSHLNNILLKKNIVLNLNHNVYYDMNNFNFYQFILNECKKNLLNKEIKFDNISTKQKKKNNENIISTNFIVNNLLNILNGKNIKNSLYIKKNIDIKKQKKKLDENIKLKSYTSLRNRSKINVETNEKEYKIFKSNEILKNLTHIKNKYFLFYNDKIINLSKKPYNKSTFNETSNLNIIKSIKNSIKDSKNFIYFKNRINNISNILDSKNTHKNQNSICEINSLKKTDVNNVFKLNKKSTLFLSKKENMQWKKAISQQVLLSISNKENKAEIRLQPESLGSIYVKIQMKDDQAKLKFISDHTEIKNFLNNCIPFLRDSLNKNGIFLKKVNISSFFNSEKNKNLLISKYRPRISSSIKTFYEYLTQNKVFDMYV